MVNRRVLRIKAVKHLYAYENCIQANFDLAVDKIRQDFAHDLNSMEPYDAHKMSELRDTTIEYFKKHFRQEEIEEKRPPEVEESFGNALKFFERQNKEDYKKINKDLLTDFHKITENQVLIWKLINEFARQNRRLVLEKTSLSEKFGQPTSSVMPLYDNKVLAKILETEEVDAEMIREKAGWADEEDKIWSWYKNIVRKEPFFETYLKNQNPSEEDDFQALDELIRKLIFKNEVIENYFEERDLNWDENKQIVRSLVLKTLKSYKESEGIVFPPLSYNWEEDLEFFKELFSISVANNDYYESIIEKKVKNWKIDRLAMLDKVILKAAICEMITFTSIPVKVTINEFIEISKTYSTPKSKKFVNGLLDAISEDLINSGEIKKSGRGLIDSK